MDKTLSFRISSGLKNIIGRELISDKYIAIFELVKNSYDAGAELVSISYSVDKKSIFWSSRCGSTVNEPD